MAGATDLGVADPDHHGVRWVEQGLQPCTCCGAQATATATATAEACISWDGGAVSECGDAVNPSLGAWPRHPCRGHPALRHRPTSDRFRWLLVGVDLGRHGRSTPCVDEAVRYRNTSGVRSVFLRKTDLTPRAVPTDRRKLSKAGWVRLRGRERHGWRDRAYMDVFTASPATGPTPSSHGLPAFDVDVDSAGAGRSPAAPPPATGVANACDGSSHG